MMLAGLLAVATMTLPAGPHIPFVAGLTTAVTVHVEKGDWDVVTRLQSIARDQMQYSLFDQHAGQRNAHSILVRSVDRQNALATVSWVQPNTTQIPGAVLEGISLTLFSGLKSGRTVDWKLRDLRRASDTDYFLSRIGATEVRLPVIVNDRLVLEPAIHANIRPLNGALGRGGEVYVLDDGEMPLVLKSTSLDSRNTVLLTKITFPEKSGGNSIEQRLSRERRASVYGIYFDFDRDSVRAESAPALQQIAQALDAHRNWKLAIEGHTDNVGSASYNLDLSRRRADAVKAALVSQYHIDAARLQTAGYGSTRPKGPNTSVQGRALNRRVELVLR